MNRKTKRILFLDVMRALAVIMMVEGHTVDALLGTKYRSLDSTVFYVWHYLRGFTAPVFMFTAGAVFTYLFLSNGKPFNANPRTKKGFKRFFLLLGLGYLLRYPTWRIIDFSIVTEREWRIFFVVDALHLIAFGLLFLLFILYLSEKASLPFCITALTAIAFFVLPAQWINALEWKNIFAMPIANYFTTKYGSFFPLFPWLGYVIGGGILGNYLALNKNAFVRREFPLLLLGFGTTLILTSLLIKDIFALQGNQNEIYKFLLRIGVVIALNGIVAWAVRKREHLPEFVKLLGRNTLTIYVAHLIVLFGSAWNPGITKVFGKSLSPLYTITAVILMFVFVSGMIIFKEKFKKTWKKKKLALAEI